jgi:deazaflavin-dependent oxidoreductase (nitroreductase family)
MKKIREVEPPQGFAKILFKIPNIFYNSGLGFLMGRRFLQLTHIGRNSGKVYKTVVEVVKFDPDSRRIYIASGFKEKSDWLKNILNHPRIGINFCGKQCDAEAVKLTGNRSARVLLDYAHRYPLAMRELAKFMGYEIDRGDQDIELLARELPMIELQLL